MFCKKCGASIPDGSTVCEKCGYEFPAEPQVEGNAKQPIGKLDINGLYKSKDGKIITGVCAGLGKKYDKNPWIFRAIFIVSGFIPIAGWALVAFYVFGEIRCKFDDELV